MKIALSLAAALSALATTAVADTPALRQPPDLAQGVEAFPRLEGDTKAARAINEALDAADARAGAAATSCLEDADGQGHWTRNVEVPLRSARFISFVAHDDYYCGGPYPDTSVVALVYDLSTGAPVDWKRLIPGVAGQSSEVAADETPLATISSPALLELFTSATTRADAECKEALAPTQDEPLQLLVWPDAKAKGLAMTIPGLPHAARACGGPLTIPADKLKAMRADAALVEDIETAPAADKGRKPL